mmetsp:Transcript_37035/g.110912  ORF Transcript_37035/g.110912 Transcript_37035/m.110912 type:complete len:290 (-) Transcript_37035:206-1075(-)
MLKINHLFHLALIHPGQVSNAHVGDCRIRNFGVDLVASSDDSMQPRHSYDEPRRPVAKSNLIALVELVRGCERQSADEMTGQILAGQTEHERSHPPHRKEAPEPGPDIGVQDVHDEYHGEQRNYRVDESVDDFGLAHLQPIGLGFDEAGQDVSLQDDQPMGEPDRVHHAGGHQAEVDVAPREEGESDSRQDDAEKVGEADDDGDARGLSEVDDREVRVRVAQGGVVLVREFQPLGVDDLEQGHRPEAQEQEQDEIGRVHVVLLQGFADARDIAGRNDERRKGWEVPQYC